MRVSNASETITLFLHGLNSDSTTWDKLNKDEYFGQCQTVPEDLDASRSLPQASCYLYTFRSRPDWDGQIWPNGDGATFQELGAEVGEVVAWIRNRHNLKSLGQEK